MEAEKLILLVVNPIAGDLDKEPIVESIRKESYVRNFNLELYETTGKNDRSAIEDLIRDKNPSRVIVIGGDGTITLVAECLLDNNIPMGIIPGGSANGLAVNFGIPEDISEQIDIALSERVMQIDALQINEKLCMHIADMGLNAELVKNYEDGGVRGKWGYFLQSIPTLINSESPFKFSIETSEITSVETGVVLAIANANKFGTGATINPEGKINDGKFEILIFKNLNFIEIFKTIGENPKLSPEFVTSISADKAQIRCEIPAPFQVDGEYIGEIQNISITNEREKLSIAVPEAFYNSYFSKAQI